MTQHTTDSTEITSVPEQRRGGLHCLACSIGNCMGCLGGECEHDHRADPATAAGWALDAAVVALERLLGDAGMGLAWGHLHALRAMIPTAEDVR